MRCNVFSFVRSRFQFVQAAVVSLGLIIGPMALAQGRGPVAHDNAVSALALLPDGRLLSGGHDGLIKIWDVTSGKLFRKTVAHREAGPDSSGVVAVAAPSSGNLTASAGDTTVRIWNLETGQLVDTLPHDKAWTSSVDLLADGQILSAAEDRIVRLWTAHDRRESRQFIGHHDTVTGTKFSPDGRFVASASFDGTVKLWSTVDGTLLHTLKGHQGRIFAVTVSPDSSTVASAGDDRTIKLWNTRTGVLIRSMTGHTGRIHALAFSNDGTRLISGSGYQDYTARVWDIATGEQRMVLRRHTDTIYAVLFTSDGRGAITGSADQRIFIWNLAQETVETQLDGGQTMSSISPTQLPRAVQSHVDGIRAACREYLSGLAVAGDTTDPNRGIRRIMVAGRPAVLVENELLCEDHFPGANCSNRGCDLVIWRQESSGAWRKVLQEHAHERDIKIDASTGDLARLRLAIYAGDRRCRPSRNRNYTSGEACWLVAKYQKGRWVFERSP